MRLIKVYWSLLFIFLGTAASSAMLLDSPNEWVKDSQADVSQVLEMMDHAVPNDFRDRVNFIRSFIVNNSFLATGSEKDFEYYFNHPNESLTAILARHDDQNKPKLPLECYSRTLLIMGLLDHAGIKTRRIILFSDQEKTLTSHTLFEVYNPNTQKWEVHDPNGNAYYLAEDKDQVLSMEDLMFRDLDKITPCQNPQKCGWEFFPGLKESINKYGIILYDYSFEEKPDHILVNRGKFDLQKTFQAGHFFHSAKDRSPARFMDVIKDWWITHAPPILEIRGSSK